MTTALKEPPPPPLFALRCTGYRELHGRTTICAKLLGWAKPGSHVINDCIRCGKRNEFRIS
jgi:hypothetical protein